MSKLPAVVQPIFARFSRTNLCGACYTPISNIKYIQSRNAGSRVDVSKSELIYHGELSKKIKWLKTFSWTSTGIFYVSAPVMFHYFDLSTALKTSSLALGCFTSVTPLVAHTFFKKYAVDLYYDKEKDVYTVTHYSLFGIKKYVEFTIADVERLGIEIFSTVKIKKNSLFFDPVGFSDVEHYKRMLGYDKPPEIIQAKDELEIAYEKLRKKQDKQGVTAPKESKIEESVIVEKNTEKIRQRL